MQRIRKGLFSNGKLPGVLALYLVMGITLFTGCENPIAQSDLPGVVGNLNSIGPQLIIPITTVADLIAVNNDLSGDYRLDADLTVGSSATWIPIGTSADPFTGSFDGNGHTIAVDSFDTTGDRVGIFAQTSNAVLHDLTITGVTASIGTSSAQYVGILAGYAQNTVFQNITVNNTLDVSYSSGAADNFYVGGVAGYAADSTFDSISTDGSIVAAAEMPYDYEVVNDFSVGSVVGRADGGAITSARSNTAITARGTQIASFAGGIVGRGASRLTIKSGIGTGSVTSNGGYSATSAGGIAGYVTETTIKGSHTTAGNITATAPTGTGPYDFYQAYAGGLVGYSGNSSEIGLSSSTGQTVTANNAAYPYAGGLIAYNYGFNNFVDPPGNGSKVIESYSTNMVYATATDGGLPYAGGLAGYSSVIGSIIQNSYATGDVSAETEGEYSWAGGLIGSNAQNSVVSKCYATGNVTVIAGTLPLPYTPQPGAQPGAAGGGIAGTNYFTNTTLAGETLIEYCAALNSLIQGKSATGTYLLHRVTGDLGITDSTYNAIPGSLDTNVANTNMNIDPPITIVSGLNTVDGLGVYSPPPDETLYITILGWNFNTVWVMNGTTYPTLQRNP
ncbi:MAG: hypothetical protein LBF83_06930 [Spirochaetaceae bacterium]|jgi:hypothetical protein|nr:hypothetical protein [Spirochaetaceae bacterium]